MAVNAVKTVKTGSEGKERMRKVGKRGQGISRAVDKMTKESVQEAKYTAIHDVSNKSGKEVQSQEAEGRAADKAVNNLAMTEKQFIELHAVPTTVAKEFDGNIAAKQTAENAKKAPIKQANTPNIPTAKGDQKVVKSTEAPAANTGVVGENYMNKYAKYIRGEK